MKLNASPGRKAYRSRPAKAPQSDPAKRSGTVGSDLGFSANDRETFQRAQRESTERMNEIGRWPTNVLLDDEAAAQLGGESRFFYVAKASTSDRGTGNAHPTVKPVDLMRYLVRLIAPRGSLVLDPFAGSGTTGQAALAEGRRCLLIEKDAEYVAGIEKWRGAMQTGLGLE